MSQCVGETLRCAGSQGTPLGGLPTVTEVPPRVPQVSAVSRLAATGVTWAGFPT
ncbi:hypothetical protein LC593_08800 [Nostoc sp. CHAB 5844]|nr:hypothetical protein [Nostoc sp. CHAB 5844]